MKSLLFFPLILQVSCKDISVKPSAKDENKNASLEICKYTHLSDELRSPKTIRQAIDLINKLDKPVRLSCYIAALKRPLKVSLTSSRLSAQPADGEDSPRIFIHNERLISSVVPSGRGADLLEFSELINNQESIKAELEFPIESEISYAKAFDRINIGGQTTCSACHNQERLAKDIEDYEAYISVAIRPTSKVTVTEFKTWYHSCELQQFRDERCDLIIALFSNGELLDGAFPAEMPTFIETL